MSVVFIREGKVKKRRIRNNLFVSRSPRLPSSSSFVSSLFPLVLYTLLSINFLQLLHDLGNSISSSVPSSFSSTSRPFSGSSFSNSSPLPFVYAEAATPLLSFFQRKEVSESSKELQIDNKAHNEKSNQSSEASKEERKGSLSILSKVSSFVSSPFKNGFVTRSKNNTCESSNNKKSVNTKTKDITPKKGKKKTEKEASISKFYNEKSDSIEIPAGPYQMEDFFADEFSRKYILNADNYKAIDKETFECEMEPISFFNTKIVPVLTIKYIVDPKKKTASIHALSGKVKKVGETVEKEAKKGDVGFSYTGGGEVDATSFSMNTKNSVSWSSRFITYVPPSSPSKKRKNKKEKMKKVDKKDQEEDEEEIEEIEMITLNAHLKMEISMAKPAWILGPQSLVDRVGNMVLAQVLKVALPDFLKRMKIGYLEWSEKIHNTKEGKKLAKKKGHNGRRKIITLKDNKGEISSTSITNKKKSNNKNQINATSAMNSKSNKNKEENPRVTPEKASTKAFWKLL